MVAWDPWAKARRLYHPPAGSVNLVQRGLRLTVDRKLMREDWPRPPDATGMPPLIGDGWRGLDHASVPARHGGPYAFVQLTRWAASSKATVPVGVT